MSDRRKATEEDRPPSVWTIPAVRDYALVCLGAILFMALLLLQDDDMGYFAFLPILVAMISLALFWSAGPVLVLLILTTLFLLKHLFSGLPMRFRPPPNDGLDLLLAVAVAVYVFAQFRLQSMVRNATPLDPRRERKPNTRRVVGRWMQPRPVRTRQGGAVRGLEIGLMLIYAVGFTFAGYLMWIRLVVEQPPMDMPLPVPLWHLFVAFWFGVLVLLAASALLGYLGRAQATVEESLLYLQDQLWHATRGEQRRINRWLVWARLKQERKEGGK